MNKLKGLLIFLFYRILMMTWRIRVHEDSEVIDWFEQKKPSVLAHWHGDEYSLYHLAHRYPIATMISTSKDGDLVNFVMKAMGAKTSRGSSTRGGVSALKGLIRLLKEGRTTSVAVDGPRGPYHEVKPGIFELARMSKAQIFPLGVYVDRAFHFPNSWNKAYLPKPFAKIQVIVSRPIPMITKDQNPRSPELAKDLGLAIDDASRRAAERFATPNVEC